VHGTEVDEFGDQVEVDAQVVDLALELLFNCHVVRRLELEDLDNLDDRVDQLSHVEPLQDHGVGIHVSEDDDNGLKG